MTTGHVGQETTASMSDTLSIDPGTVCLVGAGPGDPGLITVRGLACLESADVVIYDRLVDERLVARARPDAEVINPSSVPEDSSTRQVTINALLVARAAEGKSVVRLKGGDPFIFGRAGEEAEALAEAGIPFEVVPGVTSAIAAPAYAGIPLTHRGIASSVTIVTGAESSEKGSVSVAWDKLAQVGGTLVVLMGWGSLSHVTETLAREGLAADTPVALVQWGTEPHQRTVVGSISDIVSRAQQAGLEPPIVAVIGEVVRFRDRLRWFDNRPLFGKRVLVTRTRAQAGALSELLFREGARPLEVPTLELRTLADFSKLDAAVETLPEYDWVVFTSANAVDAVFGRLASMGRDTRSFRAAKVAAIGPATATSLKSRGIVPDLIAKESVSESLADALRGSGVAGKRVLVPGAESRRDILPEALRAAGASVDEVAAYRTIAAEGSRERLAEIVEAGIDVVTFTSSSAVRNLVALLDGDVGALQGAEVACIGPITAATAREAGLKVDILAQDSTAKGLVDALKQYHDKEATPG